MGFKDGHVELLMGCVERKCDSTRKGKLLFRYRLFKHEDVKYMLVEWEKALDVLIYFPTMRFPSLAAV